jgi:hypothetical protein
MNYIVVGPATVAPLVLTVTKAEVGGITGLSPTVAFRKVDPANEYLDWNDLTFKTVGWGLKDAPLTELGGGHYQRKLDLTTISAADGDQYVAEYVVTDTGYEGVDSDVYILEDAAVDVEFLRKMATNKMQQTSGNPGQLVLFDDDGLTPLKTWEIRDEFGGGIAAQTGVPARRGAAT